MKKIKLTAELKNGPANGMTIIIEPDRFGGFPRILTVGLPDLNNKKFKYKFIHRKKDTGFYDYIGM